MYIRTLCSLLLMAAAACYSEKAVGISKGDPPDPPAPAKPKVSTQIRAQPGELVNFSSPNAGDMDGDGFDDFLLAGQRLLADGNFDQEHKSLYLFYGKAEFPPQISTADADAVFDVEMDMSGPVGDVNGDGLGDLLLMRLHSVEFALGSKLRFHGVVAPESAGPVWLAGELPPPFAAGFSTQFMVQRAGDVDGDGCADLIVNATSLLAPEPDGTGGGLIMRSYLVRGHRGEWKSAVWDPTWASSGFGFDSGGFGGVEPVGQIAPDRVGDIDGDGRDDLLAMTGNGSLLFYGKLAYPNEVSSADADARLLLPPSVDTEFPGIDSQPRYIGGGFGDLDGDGKSDLALMDPLNNALRFVYGQRWSGDSQIEPEFEVVFEHQGLQSFGGLATGDIDGDMFPELLLGVASYGEPEPGGEVTELGGEMKAQASVYVLRGTGERWSGKWQLTQNDRWHAPIPAQTTLSSGAPAMFNVSLGGDVDGDGGQDILTNLIALDGSGGSEVSVYLVPSTPRSPD